MKKRRGSRGGNRENGETKIHASTAETGKQLRLVDKFTAARRRKAECEREVETSKGMDVLGHQNPKLEAATKKGGCGMREGEM